MRGYWLRGEACQGWRETDFLGGLFSSFLLPLQADAKRLRLVRLEQHGRWIDQPAFLDSDGAANALEKLVGIFGDDAVDYDGWGVLMLDVDVKPVLGAWADEVGDEIHAAPRAKPFIIEVGVQAFYEDVRLQPEAANEGEVAEGSEPSRGIEKFVSYYDGHKVARFAGCSRVALAKPQLRQTQQRRDPRGD